MIGPEKCVVPETTSEKQTGRFKPGQSGNPAGRPKGARHKTTLAAEAYLDGEVQKLTRRAVELALEGDTTALRLCLERTVPARRERAVNFELPPLRSSEDAAAAIASVISGVAAGELSPSEGESLARLVNAYLHAVEADEFERRLRALEESAGKP